MIAPLAALVWLASCSTLSGLTGGGGDGADGGGPEAGNGANDANAGTLDASTGPDAVVGPPDASLACEGSTACGAACVDLASSGEHCGACGHSCGGGTCTESVCQPMIVRGGLVNPVFDISATAVYFGEADKILSCPLGGCGGAAPTQIGAITASLLQGAGGGGVMLVGGGNVFFMAESLSGTSGPYLHVCPIQTGCPPAPAVLQAAAHQAFTNGFAVADLDVYWGWYKYYEHSACTAPGVCPPGEALLNVTTTDAGGAANPGPVAVDSSRVYFPQPGTSTVLEACPRSGACTPTVLGTVPPFQQLAVRNGLVYLLSSGRDGYFGRRDSHVPDREPRLRSRRFFAQSVLSAGVHGRRETCLVAEPRRHQQRVHGGHGDVSDHGVRRWSAADREESNRRVRNALGRRVRLLGDTDEHHARRQVASRAHGRMTPGSVW